MASVEVDGLRVPMTVAGHTGLEVCNTRAGWGEPEPKEYLLGYEHLAVWARYAGLTETLAMAAPREGAAVLRRVIVFREEFYTALTGGKPAWALLSDELQRLGIGLAPALDTVDTRPGARDGTTDGYRDGGGGIARFDLGDDAEAPLRAIVMGAARVLTSPVSRGVRACPGIGCGWLFYDPRGRRRWCVMALCGNRAKAARHAALVRGQAPRTRSR